MRQSMEYDERTWRRLRLLIVSRVIILSAFLLVTLFLSIFKSIIFISPQILHAVYAVIITMYILSVVYTLLLRKKKYFQVNIYFQLSVDILLVSFLVYLTGSIGSNYSLLYTLVIIYAAIFLGRRGALIFASACSIAYGLVLDLEYFGVIPTFYATGRDYTLEAGDVFIRIAVHILSFYILAFLASFVVEQEKKVRSLLAERESAFNQLDLLFRSIIESVDTGILTTTLQGRIKTFNRSAEKITGRPLRSVENRQIEDVFPAFAPLFSAGAVSTMKPKGEIKINSPLKEPMYLGYALSPLKDKNNEQIGHILIFQDMTEIRRMEENLEKSRRLALIGEMAAGLAHEMRNPLASITGSIQLMAQTPNLDETDKRLMQIILRGKDRLESFVRDFLLLSRPVPEAKQLIRVNKVAEEVVESMKLSADWREDIRLEKRISGDNQALANEEQVRQILQNLLINALQSLDGKGRIGLEIRTVRLEDERDYAEIKVTDDGCGIEEKDLKNVFEPFFTNKERGTGLGLAIVSRIVDGYGGRITIQSRVNEGTAITAWLPCR
ncbi:MAG TPA: ATP-binding protein [Smithellaceae bacterium]|nr:ATP-binding protein [Smithellaceae bacterium]HRS82795.1 ATP-binding protein [Smithellaceae bacterium]HRV44493.1 ATP-binding protein [Smithellaceae bacterium]